MLSFYQRHRPPVWALLFLIGALLLVIGATDFAGGGEVVLALLGIAGALTAVVSILILSF